MSVSSWCNWSFITTKWIFLILGFKFALAMAFFGGALLEFLVFAMIMLFLFVVSFCVGLDVNDTIYLGVWRSVENFIEGNL